MHVSGRDGHAATTRPRCDPSLVAGTCAARPRAAGGRSGPRSDRHGGWTGNPGLRRLPVLLPAQRAAHTGYRARGEPGRTQAERGRFQPGVHARPDRCHDADPQGPDHKYPGEQSQDGVVEPLAETRAEPIAKAIVARLVRSKAATAVRPVGSHRKGLAAMPLVSARCGEPRGSAGRRRHPRSTRPYRR